MSLKGITNSMAVAVGSAILIGATAVALTTGPGVSGGSSGGLADPETTTSTVPTSPDGNGWGHS